MSFAGSACSAATKATASSNKDLIDFSQPRNLSDAVLVVEESRFYVHRCILAMWSEVFSRMFQSEFKESTKSEIPLPGKKAYQVKELSLVINFTPFRRKRSTKPTTGSCSYSLENT